MGNNDTAVDKESNIIGHDEAKEQKQHNHQIFVMKVNLGTGQVQYQGCKPVVYACYDQWYYTGLMWFKMYR